MTTRKDYRNKKILKSRVIIALHEVLGRKPTEREIEHYYREAQILHASFAPLVFERRKSKNKQMNNANF